LREDISDVYGAVVGQEAAPSNLQIQRITTLQGEVKKKEQAVQVVMKKYDDTIMNGLKKEGLIKLPPGTKKPF
jgi:hypothetical protein